MPTFEPQKPVITHEPVVTVDGTLPPGRYRFRLTVVDAAGNQSDPVEQEIVVIQPNIR